MDPSDLRAARQALNLSADGFARLLQVQSGRTVRKWEAGEREISGPVAVLSKALMDSRAVRRYFGVEIDGDLTAPDQITERSG